MIQNYVPAQYEITDHYEVVFDDGHNNGFGFPCNEKGELLPGLTLEAVANYKFCLENPNRFERFNKVIHRKHRSRTAPHGTCRCGKEIELYDHYCGACQCPHCGQWYNLFGQELLPPSEWE